MSDMLGYRRKIGLLIDAANTVVAADAARMNLTGVTLHTSDLDTGLERRANVRGAASRIAQKNVYATCWCSDEFFTGDGEDDKASVEKILGTTLLDPYDALVAALGTTGYPVRVGLISPFQGLELARAESRLQSLGLQIVGRATLSAPDIAAQSRTSFVAIREAVDTLPSDTHMILQLGHNCPFTILVENIEEDLGKPVLAINQVCLWHSLRSSGIDDIVPGYGRLFVDC